MKFMIRVLGCCWLVLMPVLGFGQLTVSDSLDKFSLLQTLFASGVQVSNLTVTCDTTMAMWEFDGTNSNLGLDRGVLLSTGQASQAIGPNTSPGTSTNLADPGYAPLTTLSGQNTFDACVIEFDIYPTCDSVGIQYVFASEEYHEYVSTVPGGGINDVFAFFISGPGYTNPPGMPGVNIALIPGTTTPVSISTVNNGYAPANTMSTGPCTNCTYFVDNVGGTTVEYDAFTVPLLAQAAVQPCNTYHITLAIADASDGILDSGVFLEAGGIGCVTPQLTLEAVNSNLLGANVTVEGCVNQGYFEFSLSEPLTDTRTYHFTMGGTAFSGLDYVPIPDSLVLNPGDTSAIIPVTILLDSVIEGTETIELYYVDSTCAGVYRDTAIMEILDPVIWDRLEDVTLCSGDIAQLQLNIVQAIDTITWGPPLGLLTNHDSIVDLSLLNPGTAPDTLAYFMEVEVLGGLCILQDTLEAVVIPAQFAEIIHDTVCLGVPTSFDANPLWDIVAYADWDFGTKIDSAINTSYLFPTHGEHDVTLIAENVYGCLDTVETTILVDSLPALDFTVDPVCFGVPSFMDNLFKPGTIYGWEFGDGDESKAVAPNHVYGTPGVYPVTLTGTTAAGCVDSMTLNAEVYVLPEADFNADQVCELNSTIFENLSIDGDHPLVDFFWDFGDDSTSMAESPIHLYHAWGLYPVTLTVTDSFGCASTFTQGARVRALPEVSFEADSLCLNEDVSLISSSLVPDGSGIFAYDWNLDDGTSAVGQEVIHTYQTVDIFDVRLAVTTEYGCVDSITQPVLIHPLPSPRFSWERVCELDTAEFQNQSLVALPLTDDEVVSWTWDFGDGTTQAGGEIVHHMFAQEGLYAVTLTAVSNYGCEDSYTWEVESFPIPDRPIVVPDTTCVGDAATILAIGDEFTDELRWHYDSEAPGYFYAGDAYITPELTQEEIYYVSAISPDGCESGREEVIASVFPDGNFTMTASDQVVEIPQSDVTFTLSGDIPVISASWDFGNALKSAEINPVHVYPFGGLFLAEVEFTDANGCQYVLSQPIEVKEFQAILVPNAFSPNESGVNDEFIVRVSELISEYQISVYTRWGQLVFESTSPTNHWNGRMMNTGKFVPEGTYIYSIQAKDNHGTAVPLSGTVTVIR
ncbi:choice-of-anchor L domain-containing protein [Pontibacter sp. G13]|uniref:choice-of-anchor L domain-containing protein n=1 Tax=Pontibacter sp. G13 TaxID=3074898 RepID=UPI00288B41DF|nr:choice-of-anchor L domain-containing protein [Pontibacter sp. G13]WNJ20621.1 choice-of-anchor L domain-containing protein [Pontibacter sp. G13]